MADERYIDTAPKQYHFHRVWNTETKPLGERYNAVFVSAERKCPNEVICEIMQQIRIKTHSSN